MLVEDSVDAENGTVSVRRVGIPWHRVQEYERIPVDAPSDQI
jgi:hypothetical protein